jgi:hypothetical protein
MKSKIILSDCDGALLDWQYAFNVWMQDRGHEIRNEESQSYYLHHHYDLSEDTITKLVRQFNESAAIGFLPPLRDAMFYVKRLHEEHGYKFIVISSLSLDPNAKKLREMNLRKLFGKTAFEDVVCLATGADKNEALLPYKDSGLYWIEDKVENAEVGHSLGLNSILIEHGFNKQYHNPDITKVKTWKEIYELLTRQ